MAGLVHRHNRLAGVHYTGLVEELHAVLVGALRIVLAAVGRRIVLEGVLEERHTGLVVVVDMVLGEEHNHVVGAERHIDLEAVRSDLVAGRHTGLEVAAGHILAEADIRRAVGTALGAEDNLGEGAVGTVVVRSPGVEEDLWDISIKSRSAPRHGMVKSMDRLPGCTVRLQRLTALVRLLIATWWLVVV